MKVVKKIFVWSKCPCSSSEFAEKLLEIGIAVTLGEVFEVQGKG